MPFWSVVVRTNLALVMPVSYLQMPFEQVPKRSSRISVSWVGVMVPAMPCVVPRAV